MLKSYVCCIPTRSIYDGDKNGWSLTPLLRSAFLCMVGTTVRLPCLTVQTIQGFDEPQRFAAYDAPFPYCVAPPLLRNPYPVYSFHNFIPFFPTPNKIFLVFV